ncbi:hypothetical protein FGSG_03621 [Fusarium graminearum PH-1]|uniref:Chromosome 2, complete genome n=1 Tax=Gibberella zeae (strain ATCC MYA-4620 / CBS 123657 / FGSC 9075 / NRRL 31084 / PH-1) TaxID=229533 RepID=I1RII6_GIBZE|nr:hypothetical protein FGSG_03621 [Fusarium graminearum PH-1]ESU09580.1 hypothetical protein FGSG_03621 [Fusarium graminearum PH-1]CAF3469091.1 unnamed protein product [Fusarium graminearum]CAF3503292.1 unnamed protein product [Fusarium graminearum]CEF78461.1 unnamed protein product [Fusarium graminearum]|eukprot:XP_011322079.1 hypothetical protein FGSG_03621 [Fusarium graminearum PH-1]
MTRHRQYIKHIDAAFRPATKTPSNPMHLKASERPELPGLKKPTTTQAPITTSATILKRSSQDHPPAFTTESDPIHINSLEWPELPKVSGSETPPTIRAPPTTWAPLTVLVPPKIRSPITIDAMERLAMEIRQQEHAGSTQIPDRTEIWLANLWGDCRRGTLLCTRHEIEEGKKIERVLCRGSEA